MAQMSADGAGDLLIDVNKLLYGPGSQTVIENVFGDSPTFDYGTQSWSKPDSQTAYDRHAALNPPAVYPSLGGFFDGLKADFFLGLGILALGLVVILKIIK